MKVYCKNKEALNKEALNKVTKLIKKFSGTRKYLPRNLKNFLIQKL